MKRVYLDHSATTPVDARVFEAMRPFFTERFGNASSVHAFGREARSVLEESRERIAGLIGVRTDEVFFTSGGTEADNHALRGVAQAARKRGRTHIITSAVEHHAVLHTAELLAEEGYELTVLPVDGDGKVNPDDVLRAVTSKTCLISIMQANNEVGTLEPVKEIGRIARENGIPFHSDAVQAVGKIPVDVNELGVDLLSMSGHKFYGPKGIGAIVIRRGTEVEPLIRGGAQEYNRRAGTENVALAVGLAKALELSIGSMAEESRRVAALTAAMRARIEAEFTGVIFNGHPSERLPHILNISFDSRHGPVDGEALIMGMDLRGVAVTSGSACTSGSLQPSHVLLAMGRDEQTARATIRFSLGRSTTREDVDYAIDALHEVVRTMKSGQRRAAGS